jgi:hypothetical protein
MSNSYGYLAGSVSSAGLASARPSAGQALTDSGGPLRPAGLLRLAGVLPQGYGHRHPAGSSDEGSYTVNDGIYGIVALGVSDDRPIV